MHTQPHSERLKARKQTRRALVFFWLLEKYKLYFNDMVLRAAVYLN